MNRLSDFHEDEDDPHYWCNKCGTPRHYCGCIEESVPPSTNPTGTRDLLIEELVRANDMANRIYLGALTLPAIHSERAHKLATQLRAERLAEPTTIALHACLACGRHPSTHLFTGEECCGMCGLGDGREDA